MVRSTLGRRAAVLLAVAATGLAGCGDSDAGPPYDVTVDVVSHETTQEMAVFAPDGDGTWPVVFLYHGAGDTWENVAALSERVAAEGRVVIAVTYRSNDRTGGPRWEIEPDAECAYRYGRTIAADYGGDLDSVTIAGHSLGASIAVIHGLREDLYGPGSSFDECFDGAPRPHAVVGIATCYVTHNLDAALYQNADAPVHLIAASDDQYCPAAESEYGVEQFTAAGYDATLHLMEDANHFSPIFHDKVDGEWLLLPDDPAGLETVRIIVEAGEPAG